METKLAFRSVAASGSWVYVSIECSTPDNEKWFEVGGNLPKASVRKIFYPEEAVGC